jgi:hypothetical protein
MKPGKLNVGIDTLFYMNSGESGRVVDDHLLDVDLFKIEVIPDYISHITLLLTTCTISDGYFSTQKKHLVVSAADYQLITGQLYKLGLENILRRYIINHERPKILWECHSGFVGGHVGGKETA